MFSSAFMLYFLNWLFFLLQFSLHDFLLYILLYSMFSEIYIYNTQNSVCHGRSKIAVAILDSTISDSSEPQYSWSPIIISMFHNLFILHFFLLLYFILCYNWCVEIDKRGISGQKKVCSSSRKCWKTIFFQFLFNVETNWSLHMPLSCLAVIIKKRFHKFN